MKRLALLLALALLGCDNAPAGAQARSHADSLFAAGQYDQAVSRYRAIAQADGATIADRKRYLRALNLTGAYDQVLTTGQQYLAQPGSSALATEIGRAAAARGDLAQAETLYQRGLDGPDSIACRLALGELLARRGVEDSAAAIFTQLAAWYDNGGIGDADVLVAVGRAIEHLGEREPQYVPDALRAYEAAALADPRDPEPLIRQAALLLSRYNSGEAREVLAQVLAGNPHHPDALLLEARRRRFDGDTGAATPARQALAANPNLTAAHVFLAGMELDGENYPAARAAADRALTVDSTDIAALAVLAAVAHLTGDRRAYEMTRRRALSANPHTSALDRELAGLSARHRRYADAVRFAAQAVTMDSMDWAAWGILGTNQMRTTDFAQARASLEQAFRGDPYNVWVKNTLDLLDRQASFVVTQSPRITVLAEPGESGLLAPYLVRLGEAAYDSLARRYRYRPPTPIRLEVYRRHADFSVRTLGLPGFEALGVSFGTVLAMDSPGSRDRGAFNWGSTAWHEIAHTFTLGVTANRIPRWLSEGLSVLEERRAGAGWGAQPTPDFLLAYKAGRLPPVSRISEAFLRPAYPGQIVHAYYQASLVAEWIEQTFGWDRMLALLAAYKADQAADEAMRSSLGLSLAEVDRRFDAYMKERFRTPLAALRDPAEEPLRDPAQARQRADRQPGDFLAQLDAGRLLAENGQGGAAVTYLERARQLFPEYAGPSSPYRILATIYADTAPARAIRELTRQTSLAETDYEANLLLADLLAGTGDSAGAAAALERAIWISPFDPAVHQRLTQLYHAAGQPAAVVREREAVLALDPVDKAGALYQLAVAQFEAGDLQSARKTVLASLDLAPGFEPAQSLLLRIRRGN